MCTTISKRSLYFSCNFLSSVTGIAAGEVQYRNDLPQSTLFKVRKSRIKTRDKRQINIVSNTTVHVRIQSVPHILMILLSLI